MNVVPGQGIDFTALGQVLLLGSGRSTCSASVFALAAGPADHRGRQPAVYRLREQVEAKLSRLPLSYFDKQQRGEVLSRATNDTDNIAQTLQQTLSQIVTSLLTIVGVLAMMFWISPLLAVIALVTVPVSIMVAAKRRQAGAAAVRPAVGDDRQAQRAHRGDVHRPLAGQGLRPAATRRSRSSHEHNEKLYESSFRAQFISGIIQPAMLFIGNLNYVLVAVVGGLRVASGAISLGDVQAFIQYSRQFSQPLTAGRRAWPTCCSPGIASAERVFAAARRRRSRRRSGARPRGPTRSAARSRSRTCLVPVRARPSR